MQFLLQIFKVIANICDFTWIRMTDIKERTHDSNGDGWNTSPKNCCRIQNNASSAR